jgi:hypothetical protein
MLYNQLKGGHTRTDGNMAQYADKQGCFTGFFFLALAPFMPITLFAANEVIVSKLYNKQLNCLATSNMSK